MTNSSFNYKIFAATLLITTFNQKIESCTFEYIRFLFIKRPNQSSYKENNLKITATNLTNSPIFQQTLSKYFQYNTETLKLEKQINYKKLLKNFISYCIHQFEQLKLSENIYNNFNLNYEEMLKLNIEEINELSNIEIIVKDCLFITLFLLLKYKYKVRSSKECIIHQITKILNLAKIKNFQHLLSNVGACSYFSILEIKEIENIFPEINFKIKKIIIQEYTAIEALQKLSFSRKASLNPRAPFITNQRHKNKLLKKKTFKR